MSRVVNTRHQRTLVLILVGIIALGAFFRLYRLNDLPPGFQFDQAFYVFDSLRLLQGQFHIFFDAPGGSEPLFLYLSMVGVALFGVGPLGLKLTSAALGILTTPLVCGLARTLFQSSRAGLLAAFFTATSVWHIFYGRYGERITLLVLLAVLLFWFFWRSIETLKMRDFVFTGLILALALYTNLAARVLPVTLILITIFAAWTDRPNKRAYLKGLLVTGLVSLVLVLPLATYFVNHPDQLLSHATQVSIFDPHENVSGDIPAALVHNAIRLLEMYFVRGDEGMIRNVPNRPIFDPLIAPFFIAGVLVLFVALFKGSRQARRRSFFLLAWIGVGMAVSLISDDAPNFSRLQPIIPAVMMLPAWGLCRIWSRLRSVQMRQFGIAAFGVIAAISTGLTFHDYFGVFANDPGTFYAFNGNLAEISNWLNEHARKTRVYVAPVTLQTGTVSLLTRETPLKSFDSRDTIVLPSRSSHRDAIFAFPFEQERKAETMLERLGGLGIREDLLDSRGGKALVNIRVPASRLPDDADPLGSLVGKSDFLRVADRTAASWSRQIALIGSTMDPSGPGGRNLNVTLFLNALSAMEKDYTFSIKVRDAAGRTFGQQDKWPGDNSYATSAWSPGDLVVERFYPGLDACAPEGEYAVSVEAYNPVDMRLVPLDSQNTAVQIGRYAAGPSEGNRMEDLEPEERRELLLESGLWLFGYSAEDIAAAGAKMSLSLYWRGSEQQENHVIQVSLKDSAGANHLLASRDLVTPPNGRGLCTLFDLLVPSMVTPGRATLLVNESEIRSLNVVR